MKLSSRVVNATDPPSFVSFVSPVRTVSYLGCGAPAVVSPGSWSSPCLFSFTGGEADVGDVAVLWSSMISVRFLFDGEGVLKVGALAALAAPANPADRSGDGDLALLGDCSRADEDDAMAEGGSVEEVVTPVTSFARRPEGGKGARDGAAWADALAPVTVLVTVVAIPGRLGPGWRGEPRSAPPRVVGDTLSATGVVAATAGAGPAVPIAAGWSAWPDAPSVSSAVLVLPSMMSASPLSTVASVSSTMSW